MINLKGNIDTVISWLTQAIARVVGFIQDGDTVKALRLLADIQIVITMHLTAVKVFLPEKPIEPWPKNFFSRIQWFRKNFPFFAILSAITTNPFNDARTEAKVIALRWGFYNEVFGA